MRLDTAHTPQLLQARIGVFGRVLGIGFLLFMALGNGISWVFGVQSALEIVSASSNWVAVGAALALLGTSALAAGPILEANALRAIDTFCFAVVAIAVIVIGTLFFLPAYRDLMLLLSLSGLTLTRAGLVPSSTLRTSLLGAAAFTVAGVVIALRHTQEAPLALVDPAAAAVMTALCGGCAVGCAAMYSGLLYRLRNELRKMKRLGPYTLLDKLGEGGGAEVFRAHHELLNRSAAVKLVSPDRVGADVIDRFEREVRLTAQLQHPNTIEIYDYGRTLEGVFYYAMELLDGEDLAGLVAREGEQSPARVVHILQQITGALDEAHRFGLVHRDVKPSNIVLTRHDEHRDHATLIDFGIAKPIDDASAALTRHGYVVGTPRYMAPESFQAPNDVDARADVFAVGAVGYFLLTKQHAFDGESVAEIMSRLVHSDPLPPSAVARQSVPADLEAVILRCLRKDPAQRPQSAADLGALLRRCADAGRWSARLERAA